MGALTISQIDLLDCEKEFVESLENNTVEILETARGVRGIVRAYKTTIAQLHPNDWNPNRTSQRVDEAIGQSLDGFGQVSECLVRVAPAEDGLQIIDGEHRFNELKSDPSRIISVNVLLGYSVAECKKLTVVLNETRGKADKIELSSLLSSIEVEFGDTLIEALPYSEIELEELIGLNDIDWDKLDTDFEPEEEGEGEEENEYRIVVAKVLPEDFDRIMKLQEKVAKEITLDDRNDIAWGQTILHLCEPIDQE